MKNKPKLACGVGINDADYLVTSWVNGKRVACKYYAVWHGMITRCYSEKFKIRSPTYAGCSVSKDWLSFVNFRAWMVRQDWDNKELDKDILIYGNKIYSADRCVFISSELNTLLGSCASVRGIYPVGVHFANGKFVSAIRIKCKTTHLGRFTTVMKAHEAWQKAKAEIIEQAASEQTDERIKNALMLRVNHLRDDLANNRETISL